MKTAFPLYCLLALGVLSPQWALPVSCAASLQRLATPRDGELFTREERREVLKTADRISPAMIEGVLYAESDEASMVNAALRWLRERSELTALQKACFWEEMAATIDEALHYDLYMVSRGYRWNENGQEYYVYQGPLSFGDDLHYTLLIAPDGTAYSGLAPRITDIRAWDLDLSNFPRL